MLEELKTEKSRRIIIVLLALFVTISFGLSLDIVNNSDISEITSNTNYFVKILLKFNYSIEKDIFKSFLLFALLIMFFKKAFFREDIEKHGKKIFKVILSLLFSFFMVLGYSYSKINSWDMIFANTFQLFKATIVFIGYYILFRAIINYLFDELFQNIKIKETTNKVYNFIFIKHSFIMPLAIILVCWLPYIIAYYPGIVMQDSSRQIEQFYGYDIPENSSTNSINLIDENVKITNHHPVTHTIILGICTQFGKLIGNDNIGIFTYTILQVILFASTFAYIIRFMKNLKIPNFIRSLALAIFALLPIIPVYAVDITKDVPFASFVLLYIIKVYDMIKNANKTKYKWKQYLIIAILSLLIALFRNNGIYVIIFSLPFIAIIDKMNRRGILIVSASVLIIYEAFTSILLPALKISPASIREALSVPFQQTARYVEEHGDEVTEEEKQAIDKVLDYDTLADRYNPVHADAVKNEYNKDATTDDLIEYFKVWFGGLIKHPTTYIQATLNNTYGYFYPESRVYSYTPSYMVESTTSLNNTGEFNYEYIESLRGERKFIDTLTETIRDLPGTSWIINIAFNAWIIIIILVYLLYNKKYRYIIYLLPFISIILVNMLSPVNAYFRYAMPYIFGMPLTVAIFIDILNNKENCDKKTEASDEK